MAEIPHIYFEIIAGYATLLYTRHRTNSPGYKATDHLELNRCVRDVEKYRG